MRILIKKAAELLKLGRIPPSIRTQLDTEGGILWLEEGVPVTAILQSFKAPGICCGYRRMLFVGFLAINHRRLAAAANFFHKAEVNVAFDDPKFRAMTFSLTGNRLSMSFDAAGVIPEASGEVTLRFAMSDPQVAVQILSERGGNITQ